MRAGGRRYPRPVTVPLSIVVTRHPCGGAMILSLRHSRCALFIALMSVTLLATRVPARAATGQSATSGPRSLTVFAAASLKEVFTALGAQFDKQNGSKTTFNFGGS